MKYLCIEECVCNDTTKENDTHYVRYVKNKSYTLEGLRPILDINPKFITTNFIAISDTDESVVDYGFEEETFYLCIDTFVDDTSDYMFEKGQIYYCNKDYKLINIKISKYDAYLVAIYDPSKVTAITSKTFNTGNGQESVLKMCKRYNGLVCINGGGFVDHGMGSDIPIGYIIKDGEVIWSDSEKRGNIIGITYENKLSLINATGEEAVASGIRDGLEFGPFLIVNGQKITNSSGAGGYDRAARVAIAQRKDGIILFLVTDGVHSRGPTLIEIADTLEKYGAYNAANLDGGTSSQLVVNNKLIII